VVAIEVDGVPVISDDQTLTLPHPRARERAFVLVPWLQIDPEAVLWTPDGVRSVRELIAEIDGDEVAAVRRTAALS